jgi:hypothetical protein
MNLIAVANLTRADRSWSQAYTGFADGTSTDKVGAPTVQKNYFGWNSSFTCQNVSPSGSTQLRVTYAGYAPYVYGTVLGPGQQVEISVTNDAHIGAASYQGGLTVEAVNTAVDIACVVGLSNLLKYQTVLIGDWAQRYNAFPK